MGRKNKQTNSPTKQAWLAKSKVLLCHYCHTLLSPTGRFQINKATIDHKVALANGGRDDPSNWLVSCWSCNSAKGTMSYDRFLEQRAQP